MHALSRPEISRLGAAFAGLGLCLVGGCAALPAPDGPAAWNLVDNDQETQLAWGRPDSDEVALTIACTPHSGALVVSAPVEPGARRLILTSDRRASALAGTVERDPETDAPLLTAKVGIGEPTLASFARTGRLDAQGPDSAVAMTASGGDRDRVRAFFRRCAA
jgi:hypothetical protein